MLPVAIVKKLNRATRPYRRRRGHQKGRCPPGPDPPDISLRVQRRALLVRAAAGHFLARVRGHALGRPLEAGTRALGIRPQLPRLGRRRQALAVVLREIDALETKLAALGPHVALAAARLVLLAARLARRCGLGGRQLWRRHRPLGDEVTVGKGRVHDSALEARRAGRRAHVAAATALAVGGDLAWGRGHWAALRVPLVHDHARQAGGAARRAVLVLCATALLKDDAACGGGGDGRQDRQRRGGDLQEAHCGGRGEGR
eukprot:contig_24732_g6107